MPTITAAQVKELRDKTGAGMMECKAALGEANGNLEEAVTLLRKRGLTQAAKRAGRTTAQGLIGSYVHLGGTGGVVEFWDQWTSSPWRGGPSWFLAVLLVFDLAAREDAQP